jgi:RHS repeat-associated protein
MDFSFYNRSFYGLKLTSFGSAISEMQFKSDTGGGYRYGFNSMEKDNEINVNDGYYDFGARLFDCKLSRWLTLDPAKLLYPGISPYTFAMNTPIQALDPDGRLVIFINGLWGPIGDVKFPGKAYWTGIYKNKPWTESLKNHWNDQNELFFDGSVGGQKNLPNNLISTFRSNVGYLQGYSNAKSIIANLGADETIKFVTNSMGAVFQRGFSDGLMTFISEQKTINIQAQQGVMNNILAIENQMHVLLESPLFTNFQYDLLQSQLHYENQKLTELLAEHSKLENINIEIVVDIEPFQQTERDPNAKNHYFVLSDKTDYGAEKAFPIVGGIQPVTGATDASKKTDGKIVTTGHHSSFTNPIDLPKP